MKLQHKGLVRINSKFDPNIIKISQVAKSVGRSRQYTESRDLTFGYVEELNLKVIIKDEKLEAFIAKCSVIDAKRKNK